MHLTSLPNPGATFLATWPVFPLFAASLTVSGIAVAVWTGRLRTARALEAQQAAAELGFSLENGPFQWEQLPKPLPYLAMFSRGSNYRFSHFMQGIYGARPAVIFDFTYRHGEHQGGALRVAGLQSGSQPEFSVLPELHLGPLVNTPKVVGKVDFPDQPEFNQRLAVSRIEPAAAHALFDEERRAFFLSRWGLATESKEGWIYVSRVNEPVFGNTKITAASLRGLLEQAREVGESLATRQA